MLATGVSIKCTKESKQKGKNKIKKKNKKRRCGKQQYCDVNRISDPSIFQRNNKVLFRERLVLT